RANRLKANASRRRLHVTPPFVHSPRLSAATIFCRPQSIQRALNPSLRVAAWPQSPYLSLRMSRLSGSLILIGRTGRQLHFLLQLLHLLLKLRHLLLVDFALLAGVAQHEANVSGDGPQAEEVSATVQFSLRAHGVR